MKRRKVKGTLRVRLQYIVERRMPCSGAGSVLQGQDAYAEHLPPASAAPYATPSATVTLATPQSKLRSDASPGMFSPASGGTGTPGPSPTPSRRGLHGLAQSMPLGLVQRALNCGRQLEDADISHGRRS